MCVLTLFQRLILVGSFVLLSLMSARAQNATSKKLVCYYTNWSQYRQNAGKFIPEDIPADMCTHLIFAFGWMKKHKLSAFDAGDESKPGEKKGMYERLVDLKQKSPGLKVLLAVGGWSFGTQRFKDMAANRYTRQLFVFSALQFLRERKFDGLDLDWEFPRGAEDKRNFVLLLKELREAFEEEAHDKRLPRLLLTAAVSAGPDTVRSGYDVPAVAAYVDFINVMSYDYHGKWESQTGHNSPLFAPENDSNWRKQLCMVGGFKPYLYSPKDKLVVGMATYGRSFTLASADNSGVNAPSRGGGKAGSYTKEEGFLAFYEVGFLYSSYQILTSLKICEMLKAGAHYVWDDTMKAPYAVSGDQWVGFDDERSIRVKMRWLAERGYAGAMVWAVDMDDFKGSCGGKSYPLIGVMQEELLGRPKRPALRFEVSAAPSSTARPVVTPSAPATTSQPSPAGHRKRRQFKQTDAFTRSMVIGLKRAGWSIRQIAADTHRAASTVHRLWRRWLEQRNVAIYRNVGATRVTSARVDRRILRQAVAAPQATCTAILQHVQDTLDHSISTRTISRRLVANGLHSCRPLRRLPLTPPNRRQRLEWCRARSTWMTEWHRVVFSDESRFCLSIDSRRVRVWRRRGERSNPAAIVERPTVRQPGIMVWGAIAYDSRSPLLRIQSTITAQRYVDDVLRPVTLPYLQWVPNALYQQDNARPHTARISQQALQDVQMLPWPPYSPDLSPIEHVWDIIGRRLHALPQPRSEDELWQMVEREWRAIPQDAIRTLIDSLPRRVAACIAVRGGPTCY
ncbi:Cht7 [Cordylochernes scorpioides]|uniref:Cht7 n=1 Tax=Cordylochernes scorpioides TaxID=51811 RepID=A0ABY6L6U4_9ARAC|nr:Cht7 [Cordylochernes scorpioides]